MDYMIILPRDSEMKPGEFVAIWNSDAREVGEARLEEASSKSYNSPLVEALGVILVGVVGGVTTNLLTDLIKQAFAKKGIKRRITITEVEGQRGERILVIEQEQDA